MFYVAHNEVIHIASQHAVGVGGLPNYIMNSLINLTRTFTMTANIPLPYGWITQVDPGSGHTFYVCSAIKRPSNNSATAEYIST